MDEWDSEPGADGADVGVSGLIGPGGTQYRPGAVFGALGDELVRDAACEVADCRAGVNQVGVGELVSGWYWG